MLPVEALQIEEIPDAQNPLTREPAEMDAFLRTANEELKRRRLPLFEVDN